MRAARELVRSGVFAALFCACAAQPERRETAVREAAEVLDDFHQAASKADGERYFGHFSAGAVFIGTDASERWSLAEFRAWCAPYFERGQGWTYVARERHVELAADGRTAWFDERLDNEKYGEVRGSGVLVRERGRWRIAHYVMSFPVPNELAGELVERVRTAAGGAR